MKTEIFQNSSPCPLVGRVAEVRQDKRRVILEYCWPSGAVQVFKVSPDASGNPVLGNHYHENKEEHFLMLSGGGQVHFHRVDLGGKPVGDRCIAEVEEGGVVIVPARMAHTFVLRPGSQMVCFSSAPFDPQNMDMKAVVLVDKTTGQPVEL